jgi:hypothetical protein
MQVSQYKQESIHVEDGSEQASAGLGFKERAEKGRNVEKLTIANDASKSCSSIRGGYVQLSFVLYSGRPQAKWCHVLTKLLHSLEEEL